MTEVVVSGHRVVGVDISSLVSSSSSSSPSSPASAAGSFSRGAASSPSQISQGVKAVLAARFPAAAASARSDLAEWVGPTPVAGYAVFLTHTGSDGVITVGVFRSTTTVPKVFEIHPPQGRAAAAEATAAAEGANPSSSSPSSSTASSAAPSFSEDSQSLERAFRQLLERVLSLRPPPVLGGQYSLPRWQLFHTDGVTPVRSVGGLVGTMQRAGAASSAGGAEAKPLPVKCGTFLFFLAGRFIWPAVRNGFRRRLTFGGRQLELVTLSTRPVLIAINDFLSPAECKHIQDTAAPHLRESLVSHMDADVGKATEEWRTSSTHFLDKECTPCVTAVEQRVSFVTKHPGSYAEGIQVLRYEKGGRYAHHMDWFDPKAYSSNANLMRTIRYGAKNRLATLFWYMSDVADGGGTNFPKANADASGKAAAIYEEMGATVHDSGVTVLPAVGKAILFYNLLPDGSGDLMSLHAGCEVVDGVKWAANKWIWNFPSV